MVKKPFDENDYPEPGSRRDGLGVSEYLAAGRTELLAGLMGTSIFGPGMSGLYSGTARYAAVLCGAKAVEVAELAVHDVGGDELVAAKVFRVHGQV